MKGLLVRVGIDSTAASGSWHGPVRASTGEFVYVPILEGKETHAELKRTFDEFSAHLQTFDLELPPRLCGRICHLDPDFETLTFGDQGQRGSRIAQLVDGDIIAFFAALKPTDVSLHRLLYAIIGLFVVDAAAVLARDVPRSNWALNAHTRRVDRAEDIIIRGKAAVSGRLRHCIPIGEFRRRAYRVMPSLLEEWGGVDIKDGYLQRSAHLPSFKEPGRFYTWFLARLPVLVAANNLDPRFAHSGPGNHRFL